MCGQELHARWFSYFVCIIGILAQALERAAALGHI
jgi:hypothetical protein